MFIRYSSKESTKQEHEKFPNFYKTPIVGPCVMSQHPAEVLRSDKQFKFECKLFFNTTTQLLLNTSYTKIHTPA
jgi:hypothetical protein